MDNSPRPRRTLVQPSHPPVVLCLSGHDPSGGAGVQADIETLAALGCHAASVITCLTCQDTRDVRQIIPQQPDDLRRQAETVLADMPVAAIKIGLIGDAAIAETIARLIAAHPDIPVVLDPVLAAGGGASLSNEELLQAIREQLLPLTTLLTPNSLEARVLAGLVDLESCAHWLLARGCRYVLITGSHEDRPDVINTLYSQSLQEPFRWQRLPHEYHGSGCTLAAAVAAYLARGANPMAAAHDAQRYTWQALEGGFRPGRGQYLPRRIHTGSNP
ncbi:bifunctional hydroxymethylpyrimidine kinase/phosphomethylpyrimidine kinase [Methylogaea oryzae]|uniref:hydroxymethylpyrimidine kinase n=1 Tax=Methylogaea oryzae TaxID=1295382 RepID=A0A8D4VLW5_9GAMM|nr:hydroxymethylpyrimidine/phosphomethylpyrimidine kinase [Methylogaea oryzae]BBL69654.1 hydroxymethylpyrimidine/phosphomethylpyrimidine kinase [Methylogaea oryzae]